MSEYIEHWAERLEAGDRVTATIRHKTDGSKNRHNVQIIVIEIDIKGKKIKGTDGISELKIPFNELTPHPER